MRTRESHFEIKMTVTAFTILAFAIGLAIAVGIPTVALFSQQRDEIRSKLQKRTSSGARPGGGGRVAL